MAYTVFESINMASTKGAARIYDAVATTDVENGTFGYLNGLATNENNTYNFVKGAATGKEIVVADNPAWDSDTCKRTNQRRDKYIIKAGERFRARVIKRGDVFGISIDGATSTTQSAMAKNAFVTIDATTGKLVAKTSTTSGAAMEGTVEGERLMGGVIQTTAHNYGYSAKLYKVRVTTLA